MGFRRTQQVSLNKLLRGLKFISHNIFSRLFFSFSWAIKSLARTSQPKRNLLVNDRIIIFGGIYVFACIDDVVGEKFVFKIKRLKIKRFGNFCFAFLSFQIELLAHSSIWADRISKIFAILTIVFKRAIQKSLCKFCKFKFFTNLKCTFSQPSKQLFWVLKL